MSSKKVLLALRAASKSELLLEEQAIELSFIRKIELDRSPPKLLSIAIDNKRIVAPLEVFGAGGP